MQDLEIQKLYNQLATFTGIIYPYRLKIQRRPFLKFVISGFTDDDNKEIQLDINSNFKQNPYLDDTIGFVLIHELFHSKYPEKSDYELFSVEELDRKGFKQFFKKEFPVPKKDFEYDVKEEEEYKRKISRR